MSFQSYNGALRRIGRYAVLPVNKIRTILEKEIFGQEKKIDICVDFGAGTLFWSEWLKHKVSKVYAVDVIYTKEKNENGIRCIDNIDKLPLPNGGKMFFAVDVFHHLDQAFEKELLLKVNREFDYVVIKDINCHKKFGNFMNRIHDKIINGEDIRNVDPDVLINYLFEKGYRCRIFEMRKLWYPHFLIVAKR